MHRSAALALLVTLASGSIPARGDDSRPRRYDAIVGAYDRAVAAATEIALANDAKPEAERRPVKFPSRHDLAAPLMALAEADPTDATGLRALLWVIGHNVELGYDARYAPLVLRAAELVAQHHRDDEAVGLALLDLTDSPTPPRDFLLRAVLDRATDPAVRGRACFALAQYLKNKGDFARRIRSPGYRADDPDWYNKAFGTAYYAGLAALDPDPLTAEAERLYGRVLAEYAGLPHLPSRRHPGTTRTLGELAAVDLDEIRHLAVGRPAPAVAGTDLAGRPLRLAEHRGKVVVLVFWGEWCGACMRQVPHEKELAARMEGRPFALLGVNSDDDRGKAEAVARREGMTWPSWFDGGMVGGPIAARWNVRHWPTVFVVDHEGVIRGRDVGDAPFLDKLADDLVAAAERAAVTPPPVP